MLKTYIFVPANIRRFINKVEDLDVNEVIFDLEDAVTTKELSQAIDNLSSIDDVSDFWVRPFLFKEEKIDFSILKKTLNIGFRKFVLPKISSRKNLEDLIDFVTQEYHREILDETQFILLVENSKCLINLEEILETKIKIIAVSLGSHDYCNSMNMMHTKRNLMYAKHKILNIARARDLLFLDSASMNIKNKEAFNKEIEEAFSIGSDGKMVIHPLQLQLINTYAYYTQEEVRIAKNVLSRVKEIGEDNFNVIKFEGVVYEKPHLDRIKNIIYWAERNEIK